MVPLDMRTLLIATSLATAFCAGARIMLWRLHPGMPGLGHWAAAGVGAAVALAMMGLHGTLPAPLSLPLAQIAVVIAVILGWDGFRRFLGLVPLSRLGWGLSAVGALALAVAGYGWLPITLRAAANAAVIATLSALIARDLLKAQVPGHGARRMTGWIYIANALLFAVRTLMDLRSGVIPVGLNVDGLSAIPLLWWLCVTIAVTLGMAMMIGERLQADLDRQASFDPLTGALNRRAFASVAAREMVRAARYDQKLSVLMMDLDHFKQINDCFGHGGGDDILCRFVDVAQGALRGEDVFCRFGGEEFVALLPETAAGPAMAVAQRLRQLFAAQNLGQRLGPGNVTCAVTVSIGVAEAAPGESIEAVIGRADIALYQAKARGRNRCEMAGDPAPDAEGAGRAGEGAASVEGSGAPGVPRGLAGVAVSP